MSSYPHVKGISPMLASIILIAFVISVASIIGPWLVDFIGESTEDATERGEKDIECTYAGLHVRGVTEEQNENTTLSAEVENVGDIDLSDFWVELTYEDASIESMRPEGYEEELVKGSRRVFSVDIDTTGDVEKLRVFSADCPTEASDEIKGIHFDVV